MRKFAAYFANHGGKMPSNGLFYVTLSAAIAIAASSVHAQHAAVMAPGPAPVAASPAAAVQDAPGKGIIQGISDHTLALPTLHRLDSLPAEKMCKLQRQYMQGTQSTFVKWTAKQGARVPLHHHANEQITWIVSGKATVYSQGKAYTMGAGDVMIFPPNVPHEFVFDEDTVDIDFFAPGRQDWMDGTAAYYDNKSC
jgi:quercetin dioxygenase-like cupin family protein